MPNSWRIAQSMGITLHSRKQRGSHPQTDELPAKHSWSPNSIYQAGVIAEAGGLPDQVYDVLSLFLASDHNARQLFGDAIIGTAIWAKACRITNAEVTFIAPAFNEVSLKFIRREVAELKAPHRPARIAQLINLMMKEGLEAIRT